MQTLQKMIFGVIRISYVSTMCQTLCGPAPRLTNNPRLTCHWKWEFCRKLRNVKRWCQEFSPQDLCTTGESKTALMEDENGCVEADLWLGNLQPWGATTRTHVQLVHIHPTWYHLFTWGCWLNLWMKQVMAHMELHYSCFGHQRCIPSGSTGKVGRGFFVQLQPEVHHQTQSARSTLGCKSLVLVCPRLRDWSSPMWMECWTALLSTLHKGWCSQLFHDPCGWFDFHREFKVLDRDVFANSGSEVQCEPQWVERWWNRDFISEKTFG